MARDPSEGSLAMQKKSEMAPTKAGGLAGLRVADSQVSLVDGERGRLVYRGYDINDLAEHSAFEETAYLLWNGTLPTKTELASFTEEVGARRQLPDEALEVLRLVAKKASPIGALRSVVSVLGNLDPESSGTADDGRHAVATKLLARFPAIVAAQHRLADGKDPVAPDPRRGLAEDFLRMLRGTEPDEEEARALDVALVLHADHEFNASTFAARVTASTLSDIYSAITTAIGTLKGPLHGGANLEVMKALEQIGSVDAVEAFVDKRLADKKKVMGFGHRVYKVMDPRATILKEWSQRLGKKAGDSTWYEMSARMQDVMKERKGLYPNVDFYAASLYHSLGIPRPVFPAIFAISRVSGWLAHVLEQYGDNKLIRPLSNYTGPTDLEYTPIDDRK